MSAKDRIRKHFEDNLGRVLSTREIAEVARISEYARRIRELRDEEGMQILSHNDLTDLSPGEYILVSLTRLPAIGRDISPQLRSQILERNGYTCQLCGAGPGDPDPFDPAAKVRLHIDHLVPISQGGTNEPANLRVLCSACNQGLKNVTPPTETTLNILARIRKLPRAGQQEVYEVLRRKFGQTGH